MTEKEITMSAEEYKEQLIQYFIKEIGAEGTAELMRIRGDAWMEFYEEGWSVEETGCGMMMNLL